MFVGGVWTATMPYDTVPTQVLLGQAQREHGHDLGRQTLAGQQHGAAGSRPPPVRGWVGHGQAPTGGCIS